MGIVAYNGAGDSPRSDTKIIKTEEGGTCFPILLIRVFIERFLSVDTIFGVHVYIPQKVYIP